MSSYQQGYITAQPGNPQIVGHGTYWANYVRHGDQLQCDGYELSVVSIEDHGLLTIAEPWPGELIEQSKYVITQASNLAALKSDAKSKINDLRNWHLMQPVSYDGSVWDAGQRNRENLSIKINEINSKIALGVTDGVFVWRDANNNNYSWAGINDYLLWLHGLNNAISERGTLIYQTSWVKKAEIDALETETEIIEYDLNAGWS